MTYYANHPTTDNTRRSITKGEEKPHFLTILSNMTKRRKKHHLSLLGSQRSVFALSGTSSSLSERQFSMYSYGMLFLLVLMYWCLFFTCRTLGSTLCS